MARRKRRSDKPIVQKLNVENVADSIVQEVAAKNNDKDPDAEDDGTEDGVKDRKRRQAAFKKFIKVKGKKGKAKK